MPHILKRLAAAACMTLTLGIAFAGQPLKIESITYEPQANVNGEPTSAQRCRAFARKSSSRSTRQGST